jgi:hypothetical protein
MVKFLVGRDAEVFFVHENIISARTEYFIDTLQNFKKGAQVKVVRLPGEDPEIFTLYVQLVYTNVIPYIIDTGEGDDWECRSDHNSGYHQTCHDEYNILCRLYVLAETIEDTKAQNATISALFSKIKVSIDHESVLRRNSVSHQCRVSTGFTRTPGDTRQASRYLPTHMHDIRTEWRILSPRLIWFLTNFCSTLPRQHWT